MEMILDSNDMVVGVEFHNGTIQDYVDGNNNYGLIRIEDTSANWFLFNKEDSTSIIKDLYEDVTAKEHYIKDEYGEEIVLFNKKGSIDFDTLINKIDEYLDAELS